MSASGEAFQIFVGEAAITDSQVRATVDSVVPLDRQSLDLEILRVPERPLDDAVAALRQVGMFSGGRCVWVKGWPTPNRAGPGSKEAGTSAQDDQDRDPEASLESFLAFVEAGIPDGSTLIISAPNFDKRTKAWKRLAAIATIHDLQPTLDRERKLDRGAMMDLVRARLAEGGITKPPAGTLDVILERAGTEVGQSLQEIDRLTLMAGPEDFDLAFVKREMRDLASTWVFALTDAIGLRDLRRAEAILEDLLAQGEPTQRIIPVIANQIGELVEARRALEHVSIRAMDGNRAAFVKTAIPEIPGPWAKARKPWRVFHLLDAARRFGPRELGRLHAELLKIDLATKSSRVPPRALLSRFLQQACRASTKTKG